MFRVQKSKGSFFNIKTYMESFVCVFVYVCIRACVSTRDSKEVSDCALLKYVYSDFSRGGIV